MSLNGGGRIAPTANRNGLLMSYDKRIYSFNCSSSEDCYWVEKIYNMKIPRASHIFMSVSSTLLGLC